MIKDPDLIDRRAVTDMLEEIADKGEAMRKHGEDELSYRRRTAIANAARTLIESVNALPVVPRFLTSDASAIEGARAEDDDRALCKLAEQCGAEFAWSISPGDLLDLIEFTPDALRAFIAAVHTRTPVAAEPDKGLSKAAIDMLAERRRQVEVEGWTPEHDDQHRDGDIARAAACYAMSSKLGRWKEGSYGPLWPWHLDWWKPTDRRRDLIKAGALILAEIERLDRAAPPSISSEGV